MDDIRFRQTDTDGCLFCDRIQAGETVDVIEDPDLTIARVNGRQFQQGQIVIIPRRHAGRGRLRWFMSCEPCRCGECLWSEWVKNVAW